MLYKVIDDNRLTEIKEYIKKKYIDAKIFQHCDGFYIFSDSEISLPLLIEKLPEVIPSNNIEKKDIYCSKDIIFNENNFNIIAGPCAVENEKYLIQTAELLKKLDIKMIRGGANKLRTSPYSFQGIGVEAFRLLSQVSKEYGLLSVSEITSLREIDSLNEYIDIILVGTRNMFNYQLLKELGKLNKTVILKRGMSATVKEWVLAAEYVISNGNPNVILCERGIRTFETSSRNTFDLASAVLVNQNYSFQVISDPSHATGNKKLVSPMTLASLIAGLQGVMLEIHPEPHKALSDAEQMLDFQQFTELVNRINLLKKLNISK